ncbi:uncharacterized protein F4807DRAFT_425687 [Annulohypoxylon truncatum]|uniref:uncharacterized protein n=1 Tax=Annulohypoxylon truncatum TaxID=327061 RepID=UPI00200738F5|nr:uncharacterized protein F4807DRAFT_425687 [Annulohypoxylon truncatum]KAI1209629.1 hypothetical protein F4807DRAFT_425687 [Annulohypoxylon truncatum]
MSLGSPYQYNLATRNIALFQTNFLLTRDVFRLIGSCRSVSSHSAPAVPGAPVRVCEGLRLISICSKRPNRASSYNTQYPAMSRKTHTLSDSRKDKKPQAPRPSTSVVLLSPENQVLLLHRVQTSSSFPSAHVFPGGNLSDFHDGSIPGPDDVKRHEDSLPYRLGAIRETFEESGILIAREGDADGNHLNVSSAECDQARKEIYKNEVRFVEWLRSIGGVADTDNLIPFTRWITPNNQPRRYTTQMYLYMLPLSISDDPVISAAQSEAIIPTPDGGVEITAARFDYASSWLEKQRKGEIVLFPPQCFLLHLLAQFLVGPPPGSLSPSELTDYYRSQREKLRGFLATVPTASEPKAVKHSTAQIPWGDKAISPHVLGIRKSDKRSILGLEKPGPELKETDRGGDWERVVLVKFDKGVAREVEVRSREEVLAEERRLENSAKETKL